LSEETECVWCGFKVYSRQGYRLHLRTHGIGGRLTPKELELARRMYTRGESTIRIAHRLGRSPATINLALHKMGVRLRTQSEAALTQAEGWRKLGRGVYLIPANASDDFRRVLEEFGVRFEEYEVEKKVS